MEHEAKTYFAEQEYDDVKGFTVLKAKDGRYQIAEKWLKEEGESRWISYWIPESDLLSRIEQGHCEPKGKLTDEQFEGVCKMVGFRAKSAEEVEV